MQDRNGGERRFHFAVRRDNNSSEIVFEKRIKDNFDSAEKVSSFITFVF